MRICFAIKLLRKLGYGIACALGIGVGFRHCGCCNTLALLRKCVLDARSHPAVLVSRRVLGQPAYEHALRTRGLRNNGLAAAPERRVVDECDRQQPTRACARRHLLYYLTRRACAAASSSALATTGT